MNSESSFLDNWASLSRRRAELEAEEVKVLKQALALVGLELVEGSPLAEGRWALVVAPLSGENRVKSAESLERGTGLPAHSGSKEAVPFEMEGALLGIPSSEEDELLPVVDTDPVLPSLAEGEEESGPVLPLPSEWDSFFGGGDLAVSEARREESVADTVPGSAEPQRPTWDEGDMLLEGQGAPSAEEEKEEAPAMPDFGWWGEEEMPSWLRSAGDSLPAKDKASDVALPEPDFAPEPEAGEKKVENDYDEELLLTLTPKPAFPSMSEIPALDVPSVEETAPLELPSIEEMPAIDFPPLDLPVGDGNFPEEDVSEANDESDVEVMGVDEVPELPEMALPSIELPALDLPSMDLPSINLPVVDLPGEGFPVATEGKGEEIDAPIASPDKEEQTVEPTESAAPTTSEGFVDVVALADHVQTEGRVAPVGKRRFNPLKSGSSDPKGRAVRLAQTLASDMISYRKAEYEEARASGVEAIRAAFADDIAECRNRFYEQVQANEVPERDEIFIKAINEILGKNQKLI